MKRLTPSFLAEAFRLISACPLCKAAGTTEIHVLNTQEDACLAHVTCGTCRMALVMHLEPSENGVSCLAIVTDLSLWDERQALQRPPIRHDDVLAVHEVLSSGGFLSSLARR